MVLKHHIWSPQTQLEMSQLSFKNICFYANTKVAENFTEVCLELSSGVITLQC